MEKVSIPKDRNGKPRAFAFITYKHKCSVHYALQLFDDTTLFNRPLSLKPRDTNQGQQELQTQSNNNLQNQQSVNQILQYGNQMILNNLLPNMGMNMYNMYPNPNNVFMMPNQGNYFQKNTYSMPNMLNPQNFQNEDRRNNRSHPYYYNNRKDRDHDNHERDNRDRDNRDSEQDSRYGVRSHRNKHSSHSSNKYNNRRNYR